MLHELCSCPQLDKKRRKEDALLRSIKKSWSKHLQLEWGADVAKCWGGLAGWVGGKKREDLGHLYSLDMLPHVSFHATSTLIKKGGKFTNWNVENGSEHLINYTCYYCTIYQLKPALASFVFCLTDTLYWTDTSQIPVVFRLNQVSL